MIEKFNEITNLIGADISNPIKRQFAYYWLEGCKYIYIHNGIVTKDEILKILNLIGVDGKSFPFNSNYLIIVLAETSESFKSKDLYFMREAGEHVAFLLYDKVNHKSYYPHGFVFPLRFSYRKILNTIAKKLQD